MLVVLGARSLSLDGRLGLGPIRCGWMGDADAPAEVDTENVGDESMRADVTMSEAP